MQKYSAYVAIVSSSILFRIQSYLAEIILLVCGYSTVQLTITRKLRIITSRILLLIVLSHVRDYQVPSYLVHKLTREAPIYALPASWGKLHTRHYCHFSAQRGTCVVHLSPL